MLDERTGQHVITLVNTIEDDVALQTSNYTPVQLTYIGALVRVSSLLSVSSPSGRGDPSDNPLDCELQLRLRLNRRTTEGGSQRVSRSGPSYLCDEHAYTLDEGSALLMLMLILMLILMLVITLVIMLKGARALIR